MIDQPAYVLLDFFGSSQREWLPLRSLLPSQRVVFAFDLPGFGDSASAGAADVASMVDALDTWINQCVAMPCLIVAHSMSGKIAAVLASQRPAYLRGLILLAPSTPSPEPMKTSVREQLLAFDGSYAAADRYIDSITATQLPAARRESAIDDAMRASLPAWKYWVKKGSQEDWSVSIGQLDLPTLIIVGAEDASLGAAIQRERTLPHFVNGFITMNEGGHALPLENPQSLAGEMELFLEALIDRERDIERPHVRGLMDRQGSPTRNDVIAGSNDS